MRPAAVRASEGSYEGKAHPPGLRKRVEEGEQLTSTRHGHHLGRIVPIEEPVRLTPSEAVDRMREFGKGRTLGPDLTVRELIEFGRK